MVTFEEAYELAKEVKSVIDGCLEYDKGYLFYTAYDTDVVGDSGVVIVKEDGRAITFVTFIGDYTPDPKFKERKLPG